MRRFPLINALRFVTLLEFMTLMAFLLLSIFESMGDAVAYYGTGFWKLAVTIIGSVFLGMFLALMIYMSMHYVSFSAQLNNHLYYLLGLHLALGAGMLLMVPAATYLDGSDVTVTDYRSLRFTQSSNYQILFVFALYLYFNAFVGPGSY